MIQETPVAATEVKRPTVVLRTLPNGVRLLVLPMPQLQSASVGIFLRVGSRDETPTSNGISHVLEHMAFKGTHTRSVQAINLDAERLGAEVNAFTGKDTTGFFMSGLGRHAQQLLSMTADIVLNSTFPQSELQRELDVIRQEAIEYEEDPEDSAHDLLDRAIWGNHPMGMPVIGTVANIESFTRQDLIHHVQSHYVAEKTVVAAAGNFDVDSWLVLATELFAAMPSAPEHLKRGCPEPARYVGAVLASRFTQVSQVFVNIAYPLVSGGGRVRNTQRFRLTASLAAYVFGEGMSSPLVDTVREQLGLAYTAYATAESGDVWANFIVHAVTTPDKLEALLTATGDLLRMHAASVHPVHLERAKNQLTVSRVRAGERTYTTMESSVEELFASGSVIPMSETLAMLDDIEVEEVRAVFERMLVNKPALAITGKGASARVAERLSALLHA